MKASEERRLKLQKIYRTLENLIDSKKSFIYVGVRHVEREGEEHKEHKIFIRPPFRVIKDDKGVYLELPSGILYSVGGSDFVLTLRGMAGKWSICLANEGGFSFDQETPVFAGNNYTYVVVPGREFEIAEETDSGVAVTNVGDKRVVVLIPSNMCGIVEKREKY